MKNIKTYALLCAVILFSSCMASTNTGRRVADYEDLVALSPAQRAKVATTLAEQKKQQTKFSSAEFAKLTDAPVGTAAEGGGACVECATAGKYGLICWRVPCVEAP